MWPRWPPYWLCAAIFGNFGSRFIAWSASADEIVPMSAIEASTYS